MKLNKLFAVLGLGLFALASVGAGLALSANDAKDVKAAADPTPTSDVTQYVDLSNVSWWFESSQYLNVWVFHSDDTGGHWITNDPVAYKSSSHIGGGVYEFTLETGYSKFIIARVYEVSTGVWDWGSNQSETLTYSDTFNLYKVTNNGADKSKQVDKAYLNTIGINDEVVLDTREASSYWHNDDANTYLYSVYGNSYSVKKFTRNAGSNVYDGKFVAGYVEKFLFVRGNNFTGAASDFTDPDIVWNQTEDICFGDSNLSSRFVALGGKASEDPGAKVTICAFEAVNVTMYGEAWGYQFLQLPICSDAGGLITGWEDQWTASKTAFNAIKTTAYSTFHLSLATYLQELSTASLALGGQAVKRYDTAIVKNHLDFATYDFLSRSPSAVPANVTLSTSDTTTLITTITVVTLVAISSILVFVVIKKRKYNF